MKKQILDREQFLALAKTALVINLIADKRTGFYMRLDLANLIYNLETSNAIKRVVITVDEEPGYYFIEELTTL
jgi:hypothetical protein